MNPIAEWNVYASKNGAPLIPVCVVINAPEPDSETKHNDHRTLVELGSISKSRNVCGINSMQSLVLAMRVLQIEIQSALDDGWVFFFDEVDSNEFDLLASVSPIKPTAESRDTDNP